MNNVIFNQFVVRRFGKYQTQGVTRYPDSNVQFGPKTLEHTNLDIADQGFIQEMINKDNVEREAKKTSSNTYKKNYWSFHPF